MEKEIKSKLLDQLGAKELAPVFMALLEMIPDGHPALGRINQLEKRYRELEGRIEQGTLSGEDIDRVKSRISGGLREILLDYQPASSVAEAPKPKEETFTFNFTKEEKQAPQEAVQEKLGFRGEVNYQGSPSMKESVLVLNKSYGAAFHTAVQSIRKCGMEMVKGDRNEGIIYATAPGNTVARFGEDIYLWLTPQERGQTLVKVIVDSANPKTVFDLGRNQQKMQAILHQLRNG